MSLLKKPKLNTRWKKLLLVAVSLLLLGAVRCGRGICHAFRRRHRRAGSRAAGEGARREREEPTRKIREAKWSSRRSEWRDDPQFREEMQRKQEVEMEMRAVKQAALVRLAKINMDQAIQIATSQTPGKFWFAVSTPKVGGARQVGERRSRVLSRHHRR